MDSMKKMQEKKILKVAPLVFYLAMILFSGAGLYAAIPMGHDRRDIANAVFNVLPLLLIGFMFFEIKIIEARHKICITGKGRIGCNEGSESDSRRASMLLAMRARLVRGIIVILLVTDILMIGGLRGVKMAFFVAIPLFSMTITDQEDG